MYYILPQFNILCRSLVKPYYTKMTISPIIHHLHVTTICVFSNILDFIKAGRSICQNVLYFTGVRRLFLILPQLDILCTSAVKRYYA